MATYDQNGLPVDYIDPGAGARGEYVIGTRKADGVVTEWIYSDGSRRDALGNLLTPGGVADPVYFLDSLTGRVSDLADTAGRVIDKAIDAGPLLLSLVIAGGVLYAVSEGRRR